MDVGEYKYMDNQTNIIDLPLELIYKEISSTLTYKEYTNLIITNLQWYKYARIYPYDINEKIDFQNYKDVSDNIKNKYVFKNIIINDQFYNIIGTISYLFFRYDYNRKVLNLPSSLYEITEFEKLPSSLTHLSFGDSFNQKVDLSKNIVNESNETPKNRGVTRSFGYSEPLSFLTHITFGKQFNQKVDKLPKSLTHLTFGDVFNQKVDKLPKSLTHLTLGIYFRQEVDDLPITLTHLTLGYSFDQKVDKLPESLTYLIFGRHFNQEVENLPKNLVYIQFGGLFNQKVDNLPLNSKYIKIHD